MIKIVLISISLIFVCLLGIGFEKKHTTATTAVIVEKCGTSNSPYHQVCIAVDEFVKSSDNENDWKYLRDYARELEGESNSFFKSMFQKIKSKIYNTGEDIKEKVSDLKDKASETWDYAKDKASELKDNTSEKINEDKTFLDRVKDRLFKQKEKAKEKIEDVKEKGKEKAENIKDKIIEGFEEVKEKGKEKYEEVKEGLEEVKEKGKEKLEDAKESINEKLKEAGDKVKEKLGMEKDETVVENLKDLWPRFKDVVSEQFDSARNKILEIRRNVQKQVDEYEKKEGARVREKKYIKAKEKLMNSLVKQEEILLGKLQANEDRWYKVHQHYSKNEMKKFPHFRCGSKVYKLSEYLDLISKEGICLRDDMEVGELGDGWIGLGNYLYPCEKCDKGPCKWEEIYFDDKGKPVRHEDL